MKLVVAFLRISVVAFAGLIIPVLWLSLFIAEKVVQMMVAPYTPTERINEDLQEMYRDKFRTSYPFPVACRLCAKVARWALRR